MPRQNGQLIANDIFKYIFLNQNIWIWLTMSLKFVRINDILELVQVMAWHRTGRGQAIIWTNDGPVY